MPTTRRMRNYAQMKLENLERATEELRAGEGHDAYDRCVATGSGDPARDLAECEQLLAKALA